MHRAVYEYGVRGTIDPDDIDKELRDIWDPETGRQSHLLGTTPNCAGVDAEGAQQQDVSSRSRERA